MEDDEIGVVAETGLEIDPDSYTGEVGLSGDWEADATWEWDESLGREVLVRWR